MSRWADVEMGAVIGIMQRRTPHTEKRRESAAVRVGGALTMKAEHWSFSVPRRRLGELEARWKAESGTGARGAKSLTANDLLQAAAENPGTGKKHSHFVLRTRIALTGLSERTAATKGTRSMSYLRAAGGLTNDVQQHIDLVVVAHQDGDVLGLRCGWPYWEAPELRR
ncbi:hypothetical protein GGX14DRAFT_396447 [Mycena pura]|uniref:Uncharacterized protein n=1 Tax=Mycena pura TaxID=153505 RepID=A0AAD6YBN6_9AGAR|nr:hypothetical protein GGX14DRAFT_396447 [Mycena pura]